MKGMLERKLERMLSDIADVQGTKVTDNYLVSRISGSMRFSKQDVKQTMPYLEQQGLIERIGGKRIRIRQDKIQARGDCYGK